MKLTAKTLRGLEPVLAREMETLGATQIQEGTRSVTFEGDQELLYRANYEVRTALCFLKPIADFQVRSQDDLYDQVTNMPWEKMFCVDCRMMVDAFCMDSVFTHTRFAAQRVKDAICDRFRRLFNKRPFVDRENPQIRVDLYLFKNRCIVSLNSSGESLHRRNYRQATNIAPINEVLAAGMIAWSGWDRKTTFYDPMCGSGTLLIEACMLACQMPAQFYRRNFSFLYWNDYDRLLWNKVQEESRGRISDPECEIFGSDIVPSTLEIAQETIKEARLHKDIMLSVGDFLTVDPPAASGMIVTNPPYGERMELDDAIALYQSFGDRLKRTYAGWSAWMISSDMEALKYVGLHPSKKVPLWNGPLECRFNRFDLYEGEGASRASKDEPNAYPETEAEIGALSEMPSPEESQEIQTEE